MDEIDAIASNGGIARGVPTGFTELDEVTNGLHPGQMIIVAARPGVGKALALDTPLPTPTGWTTMGEVAVGDELLGADGQPTRVVAATEVMLGRPCYEVEFSDGTVIVADAEHQWLTETRASRKSAQAAAVGYNRYKNQRTFAAVRTTAEIAGTSALRDARPAAEPQRGQCASRSTCRIASCWCRRTRSARGSATAPVAAAQITTADPEIVMRIEADGFVARSVGISAVPLSAALAGTRRAGTLAMCVVCGKTFIPRTSQVRTCGRSCGGRARFISASGAEPDLRRCGGPSAGCGCARSAATRWAHCRRDCERSVCSETSTFRRSTCGGPKRNGAPCSPDCSTPTEP